jgi:hypothetical protein
VAKAVASDEDTALIQMQFRVLSAPTIRSSRTAVKGEKKNDVFDCACARDLRVQYKCAAGFGALISPASCVTEQ